MDTVETPGLYLNSGSSELSIACWWAMLKYQYLSKNHTELNGPLSQKSNAVYREENQIE